jgi:hypothetical protein
VRVVEVELDVLVLVEEVERVVIVREDDEESEVDLDADEDSVTLLLSFVVVVVVVPADVTLVAGLEDEVTAEDAACEAVEEVVIVSDAIDKDDDGLAAAVVIVVVVCCELVGVQRKSTTFPTNICPISELPGADKLAHARCMKVPAASRAIWQLAEQPLPPNSGNSSSSQSFTVVL